jgi:hypothetical protein
VERTSFFRVCSDGDEINRGQILISLFNFFVFKRHLMSLTTEEPRSGKSLINIFTARI